MKKTSLILTLIAIAITLTLTNTHATAQKYHEECKEDLRALFRQGTNYISIGLTVEDTLTWYDNEEWIEKMPSEVKWRQVDGVNRIREFCIQGNATDRRMAGQFKLSSPLITHILISYNSFTEIDISNIIAIEWLVIYNNLVTKLNIPSVNIFVNHDKYCNLTNNLLKFSTLPMFDLPSEDYFYAPQANIYGSSIPWTDTVDLSAEYLINNEHITSFEWFDITTGEELPITQPHNNLGYFTFTEEHASKKLRCKMLNKQFPDLTQIYEVNIIDVSIHEVALINNFTLFPNPTYTKAAISFNLFSDNEVTIEIYDILGNIVFTKTSYLSAGENTQPLDMSGFAVSSYTCRLVVKGQQIGVVNFMVSR